MHVDTPQLCADWHHTSDIPNATRRLHGVITACEVAIALTGTIILSSRDNGRRAITLVPDYELCIVRDDQIVELFPRAIARLGEVRTTPLTFFSG